MSKIDVKLGAETLALYGGQELDPTTGSRAVSNISDDFL